jgi:hypothetical protein
MFAAAMAAKLPKCAKLGAFKFRLPQHRLAERQGAVAEQGPSLTAKQPFAALFSSAKPGCLG